jgi:hypothetical protein
LGYGHRVSSLEAFLGSMGSMTSPESARHHVSGTRGPDLPGPRPTRLPQDNQRLGSSTLLRPPIANRTNVGQAPSEEATLSDERLAGTRTQWYRNINRLCIDYAYRPRLSSRLTLGGLAFPRNPWAFGGEVSHPSCATHACILTRPQSTTGHPTASPQDRRSATTPQKQGPWLRLRA